MRKKGQAPAHPEERIASRNASTAAGNFGIQEASSLTADMDYLEPGRLRSAWRYAYPEAPLSRRMLVVE